MRGGLKNMRKAKIVGDSILRGGWDLIGVVVGSSAGRELRVLALGGLGYKKPKTWGFAGCVGD